MYKKLIGRFLVLILGVVLTLSYFLSVQPKQTLNNRHGTSNSSSPLTSTPPNKTSTELPNATTIQEAPKAKPWVPQFTVKLVAYPYDVPPTTTTTINKYTGEEIVTTTPGYHVENKSIEVTISNQPFAPYTDAEGNTINIYYNVRVKGHFAEEWEWKELFSPYENPTRDGVYWSLNQSPIQSNFINTVISCSAEYQERAQVDFQVQALQGYFTKYYPYLVSAYGWRFTGQSSDWSNTQTITIP